MGIVAHYLPNLCHQHAERSRGRKKKQEVKCVYCKRWLNNPTVILICWRFSRADVGLAGARSWLYCTCSFGANMEIAQKSHCFFVDVIVHVCIFAILSSASLRFLGFMLTHPREGGRGRKHIGTRSKRNMTYISCCLRLTLQSWSCSRKWPHDALLWVASVSQTRTGK